MKTKMMLAAMTLALASCCNNCDKNSMCAESQEGVKLDVNAYSEGIQHVGIPTADIDMSIAFYRSLGFRLASRKDIGGRDFAFMQLGNLVVELIPNPNPVMQAGAIDHICLDVKNIEDLFVKVKEAGYTMLNDSIVDFDAWENGTKLFFIQGPNNEKIEFCEIL